MFILGFLEGVHVITAGIYLNCSFCFDWTLKGPVAQRISKLVTFLYKQFLEHYLLWKVGIDYKVGDLCRLIDMAGRGIFLVCFQVFECGQLLGTLQVSLVFLKVYRVYPGNNDNLSEGTSKSLADFGATVLHHIFV